MVKLSKFKAAAVAAFLPFAGVAQAEPATSTTVVPPTQVTDAKLSGTGAVIWFFRDGSKTQCSVDGITSGITVDHEGLVRQFTYSPKDKAFIYQTGHQVGQEDDVIIKGKVVVAQNAGQQGK